MPEDMMYRLVQIDPNGAKMHVSQWNESEDAIRLLAINRLSELLSKQIEDYTADTVAPLPSWKLSNIWTLYSVHQSRLDELIGGAYMVTFCNCTLFIEVDSIDGAYQKHLQEKGYDL